MTVMTAPICPTCQQPAQATMTGHGIRHDCCGLHSWHGKELVDQETHNARQEAHRYFDALWHFGRMTRSEAYKKLAAAMNLPRRDCHISRMDKAQALSVKQHVQTIRHNIGEAHAQFRYQRNERHPAPRGVQQADRQ